MNVRQSCCANLAAISSTPDAPPETARPYLTRDAVLFRLATISGFEITASSLLPKNRAVLMDSDRKMLGIVDLADGKCYFIKSNPSQYEFEPVFKFWHGYE